VPQGEFEGHAPRARRSLRARGYPRVLWPGGARPPRTAPRRPPAAVTTRRTSRRSGTAWRASERRPLRAVKPRAWSPPAASRKRGVG